MLGPSAATSVINALATVFEFGSRHARGVGSSSAPPCMRRGNPMRRRIGKKQRHAVGDLYGECDRVVIRADDVSLCGRVPMSAADARWTATPWT